MYGQVTEPTVQRKFLKVSKPHTYGGLLQDATSLYIPDILTNVHSKTRCGRINKTYKNEAKCRQLFVCSQLGANHCVDGCSWFPDTDGFLDMPDSSVGFLV